ncbi:MAG: hypothetical protein AAEJ53_06150, partial [Myxococcota bacterium]
LRWLPGPAAAGFRCRTAGTGLAVAFSMRCSDWTVVVLCAALCSQVPAGLSLAGSLHWRRLDAESGVAIGALALDAEGRELALGSDHGVWWGPREGSPATRPQRQPLGGPVRDVRFRPDGSLLVAAADGLHEVRRGARPRRVDIGVGEAVREVRRISVSGDWAVLATAAGVVLAGPNRPWRRLAALPPGAASLVALHPEGTGQRLYAFAGGSLWSVSLGTGRMGASRARRLAVPTGSVGLGEPLDLFLLPATSTASPPLAPLPSSGVERGEYALGVVYGGALALYAPRARRWETWRPKWPAGAVPHRYAFALGRHWLATDRGLLVAPQLAGPWRRAAPPLGGLVSPALVGRPNALYAASALGVFRGSAELGGLSRSASGDPPIARLQQVVLAFQGLSPAAGDALRVGAARRGWWPKLSVGLGYATEGSTSDDFDESIASGVRRYLHDRERDREREYEIGVALAWDLGDVAFHPEEVDVSRELRALVQLRADVLDELSQLYFERQRVLAEALALPPDDPRRAALALRASEFAARLDGWSGGWFSAQRSVALPPSGNPARPR